jgi:hypothetical protein
VERTGSHQDLTPESAGSDRRYPDHERWHDVAKLLVFIWAVFSSLAIGVSFTVIPYGNPPADRLLWMTYAALATLAPWAVVLLVLKWPTIGAVALIAAFGLWVVMASQPPQPNMWSCFGLCPALLTLPPALAIALHLIERRGNRLPSSD